MHLLLDGKTYKNLLPYGGQVFYLGKVFSLQEAEVYVKQLLQELDWKRDKATLFGKTYITKRKVAWYANQPITYTYSKHTKTALPFPPTLENIKTSVEEIIGESFNSCLCNLYHTGEEGMAYHSDGEKELKPNGCIASVSLGEARKFSFKHKESKERIDVFLEHGSLLIMQGETQTNWLHRLPPTKKVHHPRVNLTFRQMLIK